MYDKPIKFISMKPNVSVLDVKTEAYEYRIPENKFMRYVFGKIYKYMISKRLLVSYYYQKEIETLEVSRRAQQSINDAIIQMVDNSYGRITPETHILVVGEETFWEITKLQRNQSEVFFHQPKTFVLQDSIRYNTPYNISYFNFSVHVVPYMKGACMVKKAVIEKEVTVYIDREGNPI